MKRIIILAVALVLLAGVFSDTNVNYILDAMKEKPKKDVFKTFHYLHKKDYKLDSEEGLKRYKIFKDNLKWIKAKNAEIGEEIYGITKFVDMTKEEFEKNILMNPQHMQKTIEEYKSSSVKFENSFLGGNNIFDSFVDEDEDETLINKFQSNLKQNQSTVDWRGKLNKVKDQSSCGSCWAFAAIATVEGQYNQKFGRLLDFSEQYLVDCDEFDGGCDGGWPSNTFEWLKSNGVVEQKDAPYKAVRQVCEAQRLKSREYRIVGNYTMYSKESDRKNWYSLLQQGPVLVAMDAGVDGFGWYRPSNGQPFFPKNCGQLNHAVVAVGNEFINGTEYLIVRNSWGQDWGIDGYFKIPASNACGIFDYGWLPSIYNGTVPDPNPTPGPTPPTPQPSENCVQYYSKCGFNGNYTDACDSIVETAYPFAGVKVPASNFTSVYVFNKPQCQGTSVRLTRSEECFVDKSNRKQLYKSIAFEKSSKEGCVELYADACTAGSPLYQICSNIADFQLVNLTGISKVQSIVLDNRNTDFVTFYELPNFLGRAYSISTRDTIFNIRTDKDLYSIISRARSVLIGKRNQ